METDLACRVDGVDGSWDGRVRDLSLGGALVLGPAGAAQKDQPMSLGFDVGEPPRRLTVSARVVRVDGDGPTRRYGVQFANLAPDAQAELTGFLDSVLGGLGAGARKHPRVYRRVEVICLSREEFEAVMENVSRGGMAVDCATPVQPGEEVTVHVLADLSVDALELGGTVVHCERVAHDHHRVGIQFHPLGDAQQKALEGFIRALLGGAFR